VTMETSKLAEVLAGVGEIKSDVRNLGGRLDRIESGLRENYVAKADYVELRVGHEGRITAIEGRFRTVWIVIGVVATPVVGTLVKIIIERLVSGGHP
jgi:hypothetical protein